MSQTRPTTSASSSKYRGELAKRILRDSDDVLRHTIVCSRGETIPVIREWLAYASSTFWMLFYGSRGDGREPRDTADCPQFTKEVMTEVVYYCYSGNLSLPPFHPEKWEKQRYANLCVELCDAAAYFRVNPLIHLIRIHVEADLERDVSLVFPSQKLNK